jgi:VanZ family protein
MRRLFSFQTIYAYAFLVFVISVIPVSVPYSQKIPVDKITHFFIYLIFAFLVSNTLVLKHYKHNRLKGFFYSFSLGLIIEIVQYFLPYRTFEVLDIFSNSLGAFLGVFIRIRL